MIDLNVLRKEPLKVIENIKKKDPTFNIERLIELEAIVKQLKIKIEELRHKKNELANLAKNGICFEIREKSKEIGNQLKAEEEKLQSVFEEFNTLYLMCPNLLEADVPEGNKDSNLIVKTHGEKPNFDFVLKNHLELGKLNNWFNFEAAAKIAGANFALYEGQAVKLAYALMIYMLNNNIEYGFYPILPPYLVNEKSLVCASNFPRFKEDVYKIDKEDLYLTPTSEVNLTNVYRDHIFEIEELPIRMTSWTSCFRREAGSYGAAEKGLIRLHQFEKVEIYTICQPLNAMREQEYMITCAENILKSLGLHYRISLLAAQDCSFASAKTYDIEVWMPAQGIYKEISSASNCTDFQARRSEIRFRESKGAKPRLVYTLNASSLALPRLMVALMETYQQQNGTIEIPDVLKNVVISV